MDDARDSRPAPRRRPWVPPWVTSTMVLALAWASFGALMLGLALWLTRPEVSTAQWRGLAVAGGLLAHWLATGGGLEDGRLDAQSARAHHITLLSAIAAVGSIAWSTWLGVSWVIGRF